MFCDQPCFREAPGRTRHRDPHPAPQGSHFGKPFGAYNPGWHHLSNRTGVPNGGGLEIGTGPLGAVSLERGVKKTAPGDLAGAPGGASPGPPP